MFYCSLQCQINEKIANFAEKTGSIANFDLCNVNPHPTEPGFDCVGV